MAVELTPTAIDELGDEDIESSPDLPQLLEQTMRSVAESIAVAGPALAQSVSMSSGTCSARPAVTRAGEDQEPVNPKVPVLQLRGGSGYLQIPLSAGDPVLLVHADRSLDEWHSAGGGKVVEASDPRSHDTTDAIALPFGPGGAAVGAEGACVLSFDDVRLGSSSAIVECAVKGTTLVAAFTAFCNTILNTPSMDPGILAAATALQATLATWLSTKVKLV